MVVVANSSTAYSFARMKTLRSAMAALAVATLLTPAIACAETSDACSNSFWVGILIDGLNEMSGDRGNVIDLEDITTMKFMVLPVEMECHVTMVLRTMDRVTGVVTLKTNAAGNNIVHWLPDGVRAKPRSPVNRNAPSRN